MASGLHPGLSGLGPLLWADGENVIFSNGRVRKTQGYVGLANLAARPTGLASARKATERTTYVGAGGAYYGYTTGAGLTALGSGLTAGGIWTFAPYGEHLVACNQLDGLRYWNGTIDAAITTPFADAQGIFKYRRQVFAYGGTNPQTIERCDVDAPTDWTPTLLNDAGITYGRSLDGAITSAWVFGGGGGQYVGIYTTGSLSLYSYVAGTDIYSLREVVIPGIGAASHYSVVSVGNKQFGFSPQARFWMTDGVGSQYIDEPSVRKYVEGLLSLDRLSEITGWHDAQNSMVRWVLPTGVSSFFSLGFRYDSPIGWTRFSDSVLIGESATVWPYTFLGKSGRLLRGDMTEDDNDSSAMSAWIQTKPIECQNKRKWKEIEKIELDIVSTGTVTVQLGYSDHPLETPDWTTAYPVDNAIYLNREDQREGPYVSLKISSSGTNSNWELGRFALYGQMGALVET